MDEGKFIAILLTGAGYSAFFGAVALIERGLKRLWPDGRLKRALFRRWGE